MSSRLSQTRVRASLGNGRLPDRLHCVDRECVDTACEFARQGRVDHAMTLDPGLPPEGIRHDIDPEMRLPARPVTGMALVLVRFIDNTQACGGESPGQLFRDDIGGAHRRALRP